MTEADARKVLQACGWRRDLIDVVIEHPVCEYCGDVDARDPQQFWLLTFDHIDPRLPDSARERTDNIANVCCHCNSTKKDRLPDDFDPGADREKKVACVRAWLKTQTDESKRRQFQAFKAIADARRVKWEWQAGQPKSGV